MPAKDAKSKPASKVSRAVTSALDDVPTGDLTLQRGEPADCFLTGASRSLQRRVMGLNIPGLSKLTKKTQKGPKPARALGPHAAPGRA